MLSTSPRTEQNIGLIAGKTGTLFSNYRRKTLSAFGGRASTPARTRGTEAKRTFQKASRLKGMNAKPAY